MALSGYGTWVLATLNLYRMLYLNLCSFATCIKYFRLNLYRMLYLNTGRDFTDTHSYHIEPIQNVVFKSVKLCLNAL